MKHQTSNSKLQGSFKLQAPTMDVNRGAVPSVLINTPLQRGAVTKDSSVNRLNGLHPARETVETVSRFLCTCDTPLKPGVNERIGVV